MRMFALSGYILGAFICVAAAYNLITLTFAQPPGTLGFVDWIFITGILSIAYIAFSLYLDAIITHIKDTK